MSDIFDAAFAAVVEANSAEPTAPLVEVIDTPQEAAQNNADIEIDIDDVEDDRPAKKVAKVVEDVEDDTDESDTEADDADVEADRQPKQRQRRTKNQRMQVLRERSEAAEQRALAAEQRLAQMQAPKNDLTQATQNGTVNDSQLPDPDDYEFGGLDPAFHRDTSKALATLAIQAAKTQYDVFEQTRQQADSNTALRARADIVLDAGRSKYADYEELVADAADAGEFDLPMHMATAIFEDVNAHDIIYSLAGDPDEHERILKLSPSAQLMAIGRMSAKFDAAQPIKTVRSVTKAPRPITSTRGASTAATSDEGSLFDRMMREFG